MQKSAILARATAIERETLSAGGDTGLTSKRSCVGVSIRRAASGSYTAKIIIVESVVLARKTLIYI